MSETENYFGIKTMKSNPLDNNVKQKLSRLWFLDPDITAENVRTMTHTYIWLPRANSMIERLENYLQDSDIEEIEEGIMHKISAWGRLNGFPSYEELSDIEEYLPDSVDEFITSVLLLLIENDETEPRVFTEFLEKYAPFLQSWEIDAALDQYLKGLKLNEGPENQLLLNFE
jgi:hypothetical protein